MSFKDIAVVLLAAKQDEPALAAGEALAAAFDADLTAVLVQAQPDPVYTMEGAMASTMWADVLAESSRLFVSEKETLQARIKRAERPIAFRELVSTQSLARAEAAVGARHFDLTIMLRPGGDAVRMDIFESVLFSSGRPVLLAPPAWKGPELGRNIIAAWDGKREAARALADAAPFLDRADKVTIVTVDAQPSRDGVGPSPGVDIAAHLARRGHAVEVRNLDGLGRDEAEVLMAEADLTGADLIVMGGYGRARFSEWLFGGVTRAMIEKAPIPIFISH